MATLLYRLGRAAFRRRGRVVAVWLLLLGLLGGAAAAFSGTMTDDFTMPGTESQRAMDALERDFPQASGAAGTVVVAAPEGETLEPADLAPLVREAAAIPGVVTAMDPFATGAVSDDGRYALIQTQFESATADITQEQTDAFQRVGADADGLRVEHGGEVVTAQAGVHAGATEVIGVLVAAVVLVLTFGSLVAAGMTLLNALIGVGVGMAGLFALSGSVELSSTAPILALMLGLAVGIDYSLFLASRYRQLLTEGVDPEEAAGRATGTAGSAVVFAGATVVIALSGLSVVGIPFLTVMGLAAAATVAVAVVVALTLLPAMLGYAGDRVLPRARRGGSADAGAKARAHAADAAGGAETGGGADAVGGAETRGGADADADARQRHGRGAGFAWGRLVTRLRLPLLLVGVAGLGLLALPMQDMRLALPDASTAAEDSPERGAYDLTTEGFGPGFNARLVAVVTGDTPEATARAAEEAAGVIDATEGVVTVTPPQPNETGTTALLNVTPATGPTDAATEDTVHALRDQVADIEGADIALTGTTAVGIDVSEKLADALPVYLLLVVGLSFFLLMLVFRSVLVPLKAAVGFLLTVGATFGLTVAVFQEGHLAELVGLDTTGPLVSFLPILLIGILFGLAMDYEVFLVSRMREDYVHGHAPRQAAINGLGHNGRVVTAAAVIMISVFAGFALADDPIIKSIGFALAVGVLIDAFVVRMTLVPATMALLGRAAWWLPRPLDRALPDLDVEGERLQRELAATRTE
ncbi:putative drug exporter of the RND superfamily [Streptomyces zhaozhouensis]|uniref:Putative drug exporter of the RND superfamily n=1 Tax=Streptomyces zhaozhouensis TaxID=1300267 RepID=A0A286E0B2_9ACTN|nr:MMPL family transporter [Streptomyces zhaozhouensis]SOD64357.1 putative drug exporter of the RND superfamily [Streptomyces zhaozhouensis]